MYMIFNVESTEMKLGYSLCPQFTLTQIKKKNDAIVG